MIAVALVQGNLAVEIGERLADSAPADFYIDIQPDQLAEFERIVAAVPGARFEQVPMLQRPHHAARTARRSNRPRWRRRRNGRCATSAA